MIGALNLTNQMYKQHLQQDIIIIKNQHFKVGTQALKPAVTTDIQAHLNSLFKQRRDFFIDYKILQDKILYGTNPATYRKQFEEVHANIHAIQTQIDDVYDYYDTVSEPTPDLNEQLKAQVENMLTSLDETTIPQYIKQYTKLKKIEREYEQPHIPEHIVLEVPKLTSALPPAPKPEKKLEKKPEKPQKPEKPVNAQVIKEKIKDLIKQKFKPQNFEQCSSQKRSQPYFMKKEEILEVIANNKELESTMPSNYKSLSKENLCKFLFQ